MTVKPLGTVKVVPIGSVKPYPKNPRKIPDRAVEMVAKSLTEFGWKQPIVVDEDHVIIVGHVRHRAAVALGLKKIPVVVADDLTEAQAKAYRIADNRDSDYTSWDFPELTAQLDELAADFMDVLGLADWEGVLKEFGDTKDDLSLDLEQEITGSLRGEFTLTVVCESEAAAREAAVAIINLPGVVDVRDKR